jgi:intein/homing endonuclease
MEIGVKETEGTEETDETKEIKDLKEGDVVSSFDPEIGEIKEGTVSDVRKLTREGYYELETESGKKVKVTAEHPFLAVKNESFIAKLKEAFSRTLTYQLITSIQTKVTEVLH